MKNNQIINCISCFKERLNNDTVALNKKLLGKEIENFYCLDCLAVYLNTTVDDLIDKIEEFKEEGCSLFK